MLLRANLSTMIPPVLSTGLLPSLLSFTSISSLRKVDQNALWRLTVTCWLMSDACALPYHHPPPQTQRQKGWCARCGGHLPLKNLILNKLPIPCGATVSGERPSHKSTASSSLWHIGAPTKTSQEGEVRQSTARDGWVSRKGTKTKTKLTEVAFFLLNATCHQGASHACHFLPLWSECLQILVSAVFRCPGKFPAAITEKQMWTSSLLFTCELV